MRVAHFVAQREKEGCGPSTIRKDLITLGTMFRWAEAMGLCTGNPADPKVVKRLSVPPTPNVVFIPQNTTFTGSRPRGEGRPESQFVCRLCQVGNVAVAGQVQS